MRLAKGRVGWVAVSFAVIASGLSAMPASAQKANDRGEIIVFAAASLKNALDAVTAQWQKETGNTAKISYAASSALAKQLEQDAPAQVFISADLDWMDYVAGKSLIRTESRVNLLGNSLVLIAPKESAVNVGIKHGFDLAAALGTGRLAMANVEAVPAGKYGKAALEKLGAWTAVSNKIAQAENVRAALLLVSRGEAPLGIVYRTDAASDPNVKIVGMFPADAHPAIVYPIALTTKSNAASQDYLSYVQSAKAKPLFEVQGFTVTQFAATN